VWAIKGASETSGQRSPIWPSGKSTRKRSRDYKPVIIGTNAGKDRISSCIQIEVPGPGYMHFGPDWDVGRFAQIASSNRLVVKKRSGRAYRVWELKRNHADEALDDRVYAYAALWGLIVEHRFDLDKEAAKVGATESAVVRLDTPDAQRIAAQKGQIIEPAKPEEKPAPKRRRVNKSKYLQRIGR
jgi:phage terminase large subunit GpA-like protein